AFPQAVTACVVTLKERPITTLAVGLLGKIVLGIIYLLLFVTVVGILIIPFVQVAVVVAFLVGKVAILECLGGGIGKTTGLGALQKPLLAFVLGAAIVTLIYTVPVLGLLTFFFISAWGFGAAVTAAYLRLRRERPPKSPSVPPTPSAPPGPFAPAHAPASAASFPSPVGGAAMDAAAVPGAAMAGAALGANFAPTSDTPPPAAPLSPPPLTGIPPIGATLAVPSALAYPRAGFWLRMAAGFLDMVLVAILGHEALGLFFLVAVAYFSGMLAWKGTTVGGIILRLQVVRADGQPLSFVVALVRSLAAVFSVIICFLGFFWIGWDSEKQGWHDKIAGTVVVRM
ncbi:MAG TPA: RDD family protein, partial [Rhizomicrobium sp.]